ncbi:MAG: HDIG domain-containing protein [Deltaproteobacteria bacterium]|nr:HDIG domain-containing protein [Deltaproteobacteria bacterium]
MGDDKTKKEGKTIDLRSFSKSLTEKHIRWLLLIGISVLITLLLFPNLLVPVHTYKVGDIAERDIKSPKDFLIKDEAATAEKRQEAARSVLMVYDFDDNLIVYLRNGINNAFQPLRALLDQTLPKQPAKIPSGTGNNQVRPNISVHDQIWEQKGICEKILGIEVSEETYTLLEKNKFSMTVENSIVRLLQGVLHVGVIAEGGFRGAQDRGITLRRIGSKVETTVKDVKRFYSLDQAREVIKTTASVDLKRFSPSLRTVLVGLAQRLLQPNITLNKNETEERKQTAIEEVNEVFSQIKKGEMLLREGERVQPFHILKLEALSSEVGQQHLLSTVFGLVLLLGVVLRVLFVTHLKGEKRLFKTNKDLLFLCVMLAGSFLLSEIFVSLAEAVRQNIAYSIHGTSLFYAAPVAAGAMIVCLFMGMEVAVPFALVMAFCAAFLFENRFEFFSYFLLNGMMGAYWTRSCKERGVLIKAGLKVGLVNVVIISALDMYQGSFFTLQLPQDWLFGFLGGVVSGIITTGITPLLEMAFDYTTDIKLLELANLDRPVLRKLTLEAPGTYHHSVIVGNMVEAAAASIGANPLLAKVIGYYHDIGKISKPLYFIENQMGSANRHDKLAPSMSSLILIAHVKDGVEMAKKYRLGQAITDAIQQHHGTSLISFFYEKAKKMKGEDAVTIDDFRYTGPKPQTKEAALVLLADVVEAASRSLENPTPSRIKGMLQKMINKVFLDGQLDDCELTLKDLHEIAKSFNKTLTGIYHHRVEYPGTQTGGGKRQNGDSDRQQAKSVPDKQREDKEEDGEYLKRLGMS